MIKMCKILTFEERDLRNLKMEWLAKSGALVH